jgi:hypothetical protein
LQHYFFFGFFLLLAFFFVATKLDAELDYLTIPKANAKELFWRRQCLLVVGALFRSSFCHSLRRVKDFVIIFEVAQEGYPIVNVVFYYQVTPAVTAFNDVFVQTRFHQYIMVSQQLE